MFKRMILLIFLLPTLAFGHIIYRNLNNGEKYHFGNNDIACFSEYLGFKDSKPDGMEFFLYLTPHTLSGYDIKYQISFNKKIIDTGIAQSSVARHRTPSPIQFYNIDLTKNGFYHMAKLNGILKIWSVQVCLKAEQRDYPDDVNYISGTAWDKINPAF